MPVKAAIVPNTARNASPISLCTAACRAGVSAAMASGPWSIMAPNSFAVSGFRAAMVENKTAATMAVPKAAPTERENCTIAAPVPSIRCPATAWTVTCTTPMTVPMKQAIVPKT